MLDATTNMDIKTGVRYGVIPVNELDSSIYEEMDIVCPCEECEVPEDEREHACDTCEACSNVYKSDNLHYVLDDDNDVWVFKSPFVTKCRLCSPCAPNAGYIKDQDEDGYYTYILPPDYFVNPDNYTFIKAEDVE